MNSAPNPPMPNPRQAKGFMVTIALPSALPASRLQVGDTFALHKNPGEHLLVEQTATHPDLPSQLIIAVSGKTTPITLHIDEPIRPLRMPRTVHVTCQLCDQSTETELELVANGEPKTWVCNRH
ncbi:hypothetical protein OIA45_19920 [Streptomyces chartreusis]|uniref:hypothetical protein n=1 Tax=Streptomyces chartreusis TaxID=1969 RepID=UPI0038683305|nr:hypothetical protein OIA45_19920 [Streptomyces chartreusis]